MSDKVDIELPGGAKAALSYAPPKDPPSHGKDWAVIDDLPGITVTVTIPTNSSSDFSGGIEINPNFVDQSRQIFKETLGSLWGAPNVGVKSVTFRKHNLLDSENCALELVEEVIKTLDNIFNGRNKRLAEREVTIKAAISKCGKITPTKFGQKIINDLEAEEGGPEIGVVAINLTGVSKLTKKTAIVGKPSFHYSVEWSDKHSLYTGTCVEFPGFVFRGMDQYIATTGIAKMVASAMIDYSENVHN